jgi:cystathionine beta-lyase family protein involved in aluminum resistance
MKTQNKNNETKTAAEITDAAEKNAARLFKYIDGVALANQRRVLNAFRELKISPRHFAPTSGYGYDDAGRGALSALFARVFGAEAALVSPLITSGTHALALTLFGILRPGDTLLCLGKPYDTLNGVINGRGNGSLADFGINYREARLKNDGGIDAVAALAALTPSVKIVFIQRSRGYNPTRRALSTDEIGAFAAAVRQKSPDVCVAVDNCYGEFTDIIEPTAVGADVCVGSLIKNPGGGDAPTGAYAVGKKRYIDLVAARLTAPGIGAEAGSYAGGYGAFFKGLFAAPHVTAQALKSSVLFAFVMNGLGCAVSPAPRAVPRDVIRAVLLGNETDLIAFCRDIQAASPVDSHVTPYPWDMPGYGNQVIMAAGTFTQGASIELTCDAPLRPPYAAYLQGALTYEHARIAAEYCAAEYIKRKNTGA